MESLCGEMIDNTIECLNAAELDWKRTTRRGRILCETYEQDIQRLRKLRDRLRPNCPPGTTLDELSMGMSGDFEVAIAEGATIVRVGSAIFGARHVDQENT